VSDFLSRWPWRGPITTTIKRGSLAEMRAIAADVAERHGIAVTALFSRYGQFAAIHCRQEAMAAMYATQRYSLPRIGRFFDRDHTTVLHAVRAVERRATRPTALAALTQQEAA
jgi:chromosomal replication initiation ATPase DnaA